MSDRLRRLAPVVVLAVAALAAVRLIVTGPRLEPAEVPRIRPSVRVMEAAPRDVRLRVRSQGTALSQGEIATLEDGFAPGEVFARVNGEPAVVIDVKRVGDEDVIEISRTLRGWVDEVRARLPDGVALTIFQDESHELQARLDALIGSARSGLVLVLIALGLFLRFRLALWVAAGVPISFLGAAMLFPAFGLSISTVVIMSASLVLVHFVNRKRELGGDAVAAVLEAGVARSRAIFLTSATTFVGLLPLMFESDPAAFMVIPLAISLATGVAISSLITLFVVPSLYAILDDLQSLRSRSSLPSGATETV